MTRMHFTRLAWELRQARLRIDDLYHLASDAYCFAEKQWECDVVAIAEACQWSNPRFKWETFYRAAGLHRRPDGSMFPMVAPR